MSNNNPSALADAQAHLGSGDDIETVRQLNTAYEKMTAELSQVNFQLDVPLDVLVSGDSPSSLNFVRVTLSILEAEGDDVVTLARHFLNVACQRDGRSIRLSEDAERVIGEARWAGNVRQLQNEMQRLVALAEGGIVKPEDLSPDI